MTWKVRLNRVKSKNVKILMPLTSSAIMDRLGLEPDNYLRIEKTLHITINGFVLINMD